MRGVVVLHDHIAIGPAGVTVIDAKRYRGRIAVERRGGLDPPSTSSSAVATAPSSSTASSRRPRPCALLAEGPHAAVPVRGVLCFVDGDWPWSGSPRFAACQW